MSKQVLPTAPSPTTTHLMFCMDASPLRRTLRHQAAHSTDTTRMDCQSDLARQMARIMLIETIKSIGPRRTREHRHAGHKRGRWSCSWYSRPIQRSCLTACLHRSSTTSIQSYLEPCKVEAPPSPKHGGDEGRSIAKPLYACSEPKSTPHSGRGTI